MSDESIGSMPEPLDPCPSKATKSNFPVILLFDMKILEKCM